MFVGKVMSLLFNMLSKLVITFLPRSECLLIPWLQSPSAVILETKKTKSVTVSIASPSIYHEAMGLDVMILIFRMLSFKPTFSLSSFTFIKVLFSSSSLSAIRVVSSAYLKLLILLLVILILVYASSSPAFLMINRVTIYSLDLLLFLFGTSLLCVCVFVTQSCLTLCNPMDCSLPGSFLPRSKTRKCRLSLSSWYQAYIIIWSIFLTSTTLSTNQLFWTKSLTNSLFPIINDAW